MLAEDGKMGPRGGSEGHSGRLAFTPVSRIRVGTLPGQGEKNGTAGTETTRLPDRPTDSSLDAPASGPAVNKKKE
jgi:hypothetical protein